MTFGRLPHQPILDPTLPDIGGETENGKRRCDEPYWVNGQIVARCQKYNRVRSALFANPYPRPKPHRGLHRFEWRDQ